MEDDKEFKLNIKAYVIRPKNLTDEEILNEYDIEKYYKGMQCLHCKNWYESKSDYGVCLGKDSLFCNIVTFEHFTCKKYKERKYSEGEKNQREMVKVKKMLKTKGVQLINPCEEHIEDDSEEFYVIDYDGFIYISKK